MSIMMMCCKSVGTDLSMLDIDDLLTEICQLKKEVKLLETKLREKDELNRKDVSLCDQTSPDLQLSVCNIDEDTSEKLKTQIKEEQTDEDDEIYLDLLQVKEESSEPTEIKEEEEESLSSLKTENNCSPKQTQTDSPTCFQCGRTFTRKSDLLRHMKSHTGERPYRCDRCGNTFIRKCHLKRHMNIHTREKPYACEQCGKVFLRKCHLNVHMRVHTRDKPYKCDQCGKTYSFRADLKMHMNIHTGEKPYTCHLCGKSFAWANVLKEHLLRHSVVR